MKPLVIIGSDHAGLATKQAVMKHLATKGYTLLDVGTFTEQRVDYPVYAAEVAKSVAKDHATKGILVCGTGTGMAMAANRIKGARAALGYDRYSVRMAREHNDANILALRGREFSSRKAAQLAQLFLETAFSGEPRHKKRIRQLDTVEK